MPLVEFNALMFSIHFMTLLDLQRLRQAIRLSRHDVYGPQLFRRIYRAVIGDSASGPEENFQ